MAGELPSELIQAIKGVKQIKTGDVVISDRYSGYKAERWQPTRKVAWQQPNISAADRARVVLPQDIIKSPAVSKKLSEIDSEYRREAILRTLAEAASVTDYSNPYPTPLTAGQDGIGLIDMVENIVEHNDPPALWDPRIWFSQEQIQKQSITIDKWNPVYWDQETPTLDPREVESDIRKMYGDEGLKLTRDVMLHVALENRSQKHLNEMDFPMRVPVVMMDIWGHATQSKSFEEFMEILQTSMRESYKDESYVLGRRFDTPLDPIVDLAEGALGVLAKVGLIHDNSGLFKHLTDIRKSIKKGWEV